MKHFIAAIVALSLTTPAIARDRHYNNYRHEHRHDRGVSTGGAVAIGIAGRILGSALANAKEKDADVIVVKEPRRTCRNVTVIVKDEYGYVIDERREILCR